LDITEVRVTLKNEERLKAFVTITFDECFVVRGLRVISGGNGFFVSMPSRRTPKGTFQDIAHPINNDMRKKIENVVLDAFEAEINHSGRELSMVSANSDELAEES
jgi:stage V sporulation protein G